ncbi:hypothetical protein ACJX0J_023165, partial [Zea mays]
RYSGYEDGGEIGVELRDSDTFFLFITIGFLCINICLLVLGKCGHGEAWEYLEGVFFFKLAKIVGYITTVDTLDDRNVRMTADMRCMILIFANATESKLDLAKELRILLAIMRLIFWTRYLSSIGMRLGEISIILLVCFKVLIY